MKRKVLYYLVFSLFLTVGNSFLHAQDIKKLYEKGFPKSSGKYEPGVKGRQEIEFYNLTNYYGAPYDIKATFPFEDVPECTINRITVNGMEIENFVIFNNHIYSRFKKANGNDDLVIACMAGWEYDEKYNVKAYGTALDGKKVELSVSDESPKKDVEFHLPDDMFGSKYITVNFTKGDLNGLTFTSVLVNGLPLKKYRRDNNKIYLPLNWGANGRYSISLMGNKAVSFKVTGPKTQMGFRYPSSTFPFYNLVYTFDKNDFDAFEIKKVYVNGSEVRDFKINDDGESAFDGKVTGNSNLSISASCSWIKGGKYSLKIEGEDNSGSPVVLKADGVPLSGAGYWNSRWKYYAAVIMKETEGLKREQEPVHIKLALYSDRLTAPQKEIRVVEVDRYSLNASAGPYKEIPSQVYNCKTWNNQELINKEEIDESTGEKIVRYLPTTTLEIAFFANVLPYSEKVYLVFYGNPNADKPVYKTDLTVSGPEIGQVVENSQYKIDLDDKSGAVFSIHMKRGKNRTFEHKLETNGAVHWNPGIYSPPHAWVHASDWKEPEFEQIDGPVFHMTKRYAHLPHMKNIRTMITYIFYAGKPYFVISSLTEVLEETYVKALRNGEIVFNHEELNEFAYKSSMGEIKTMEIEGSRPHPGHTIHIPYDVKWLAFINRGTKIGFGGITMELANTNRYGGLSDAEQPYIYVANGPWIYWSRALNYSFGSNNPSRMICSAKGSMYYEKTAYLPFILNDSQPAEFDEIEHQTVLLNKPVHIEYYLDTDTRNNKGWVVPILVEPFDEGVKGAVGGQKKKNKDK